MLAATPQIIHVSPVSGGSLRNGAIVAHHYRHGSCDPGSEVVSGAYRCGAADIVADPCFKLTDMRVACQYAPWSRHVGLIDVERPLEPVTASGGDRAWGVQLPGGRRCVASQGAVDRIAGRPASYYCGRMLSLVGVPRAANGWRVRLVHYGRRPYPRLGGRVVVTKAWYGG